MIDKLNDNILAIDTATAACSVALKHRGEVIQAHAVGNNIHSKELLGMIVQLTSEAGIRACALSAVAVTQGPGSFTGLRIGVGVAQGIAYAAACEMIGVPSLDALAYSQFSDVSRSRVIAAIDARMGEVYWAEYEVGAGVFARTSELKVTVPQAIRFNSTKSGKLDAIKLVGNAWSEYWNDFDVTLHQHGTVVEDCEFPRAGHLLELALSPDYVVNRVNPIEFAPLYVRDDVAKKSTKPLPGTRVE